MKKLLFLTNYQNERVQIWAIYVLNQILELCPSLVSNRTALALELLRLALNKKSIELSIVMFFSLFSLNQPNILRKSVAYSFFLFGFFVSIFFQFLNSQSWIHL